MGALKNFAIEAAAAGADPEKACQNIAAGMLWQQAIEEALIPEEELEPEETIFDFISYACLKPEQ